MADRTLWPSVGIFEFYGFRPWAHSRWYFLFLCPGASAHLWYFSCVVFFHLVDSVRYLGLLMGTSWSARSLQMKTHHNDAHDGNDHAGVDDDDDDHDHDDDSR